MDARWYVIHVYSGFERKVAQSIEEQAKQAGMAERIQQIMVPMEEVVEVRRGQKVNAERKFFPGYVLVKMEMTDDTWHLVKNTPKVTGFLGGRGTADADRRRRGGAHPASGAGRDRAAEAVDHLRDRRAGAGLRRTRSPRSAAWSRRSTRRGPG